VGSAWVVLTRLGQAVAISEIVATARAHLGDRVVALEDPAAADGAMLIRPDRHLAWRGHRRRTSTRD
jgi:hypothetical protein